MPKPVYLGELEQLVLLALVRLEPNAYGAAIWREIEIRAERRVRATTVYTALDRLAEKGFIDWDWGDATPVQGGRAKKFYKITDDGRGALVQSMQAVNRMQKGVKLGFST
jgi:PadR family transcriptional regulator PadR